MGNINRDYLNNILTAKTADEMIKIGGDLSKTARPGMVIALTGSLGAGKTTLVKGIALGLEVSSEITSPSFTIIKEYYDGRLPLYHMDLYRIDNFEELYMIGFEELIYGNGLSIIEWSEKAEELLPKDVISIKININADNSRELLIRGLEL